MAYLQRRERGGCSWAWKPILVKQFILGLDFASHRDSKGNAIDGMVGSREFARVRPLVSG